MKINRPRLLFGSLAVAVVVSLAGGYFVSQSNNDTVEPDAVIERNGVTDTLPAPDGELPRNEVLEGELLPAAIVLDGDDNEISTQSFLGQPLVINFWFSTCIPCERELPDFAEVHDEVGDEVRFIGINTVDSVPVMERFAAERGVEYELYLDFFAELVQGAGVAAFPHTLFVTSDGVIIEQAGVLDADELREKVANLQAKDI